MTDEIQQLLKALRLRKVAEILDEELSSAAEEQRSYQDVIVRLLRAQWHAQQQSALAWRIERARLPEQCTLESFPFKKQPGISQRQMRAFAELDFVAKGDNLVFIGPTGVGKTGLASALLLKALQNGHRGAQRAHRQGPRCLRRHALPGPAAAGTPRRPGPSPARQRRGSRARGSGHDPPDHPLLARQALRVAPALPPDSERTRAAEIHTAHTIQTHEPDGAVSRIVVKIHDPSWGHFS